jgi:ribosomal RNA-processing protein 8
MWYISWKDALIRVSKSTRARDRKPRVLPVATTYCISITEVQMREFPLPNYALGIFRTKFVYDAMPLFEIPGWSLLADPVVEPQDHGSKKRKRTSTDTDKTQSMEINLDKLVKRLKGSSGTKAANGSRDTMQADQVASHMGRRGKTRDRGNKSKTDDAEERKKSISLPRPLKATTMDSDMVRVTPRTKKPKRDRPVVNSSPPKALLIKQTDDSVTSLTSLQRGMKQSLDGARFRQVRYFPNLILPMLTISRLINESLYKTDSQQAHQMMLDDPKVYEDVSS